MPSFPAEHPTLFNWIVLPLLIFTARTVDMTLSTLRIVSIAQGRRLLAPAIGFVESLIWLLVISQVFQNLTNPLCIVAYAGGFAAGNLIGLDLEHRLAFGMRLLRVILRDQAAEVVEALREASFAVTVSEGEGLQGPVKILFTLIRRRDLPQAIDLVRRHNPRAFFTVEDVRQAAEGFTGLVAQRSLWAFLRKSG